MKVFKTTLTTSNNIKQHQTTHTFLPKNAKLELLVHCPLSHVMTEPGVAVPWVFFDFWADLVLHDVITRQDILRLLQHSGKRDLEESKHPKSEL